jgi:hypothetical protein
MRAYHLLFRRRGISAAAQSRTQQWRNAPDHPKRNLAFDAFLIKPDVRLAAAFVDFPQESALLTASANPPGVDRWGFEWGGRVCLGFVAFVFFI